MSEIHSAVGSYVVNALDPDELEEFEAHLAVCPTCTREVQEFTETAAELSLLASATPPAALRGSILAAISEVRPLPPESFGRDRTC
jgi:anti-sigma factor RsiW